MSWISTDTEQHIGLGVVVGALLTLFTWTVKRFISSEQKTLKEETARRKEITDRYIERLEQELEEERAKNNGDNKLG